MIMLQLRLTNYTTKKFSPTSLLNFIRNQNVAIAENYKQFSADAATKSDRGCEQKDDIEILHKLKQTFNNETAAGGVVPIYKKALLYGNKIAIKDATAEFSYAQLYNGAKKLSTQISNLCGSGSSSKVAFLCTNSAVFTLIQWACWFSGQIAVPLNPRHPTSLLEYYIKDSDAKLLITIPEHEKNMNELATNIVRPLIIVDHTFIPASLTPSSSSSSSEQQQQQQQQQQQINLLDPKTENIIQLNDQLIIEGTLDNAFYSKSNAMILYTSGSTGKPKGVVITHRNIDSQLQSLTHAWSVNDKDNVLHVLPLNHVHGCINALMLPLNVGAKIIMQSQFESHNVWSALLNVNMPTKDQITLFMGVPTIYSLLITEYEKVFSKNERMIDYIRGQCEKKIRLMISGSAPLPISIYNKWYAITGHKLLERYGMTEIGMVLSNPYIMDKSRSRTPGSVGLPLPGTQVKLVNDGKTVIELNGEQNKGFWCTDVIPPIEYKSTKPSQSVEQVNEKSTSINGELYVRGPNVFKEYYKKSEETIKVFDDNGWFKTGDEAKYENGVFKIMGRTSVDIIKTGGHKVSALEIETHLMEHPAIVDVCVIGIPDDVWGQKIAALIVCKDKDTIEIIDFREWCEQNIANYQIPTVMKFINEMPRNAMGKINKTEILNEYFVTK